MYAMTLTAIGQRLEAVQRPDPTPGPGEVLLAVQACAVCRTDLHVVDGELPDVPTPIVPGHEIVGRVLCCGSGVSLPVGMRLGVPWLGWTCGICECCRTGQENLCDAARFTGYQRDGGYADRVLADARYCFPLPEAYTDAEAAPLLCAGLIGYRSLRLAGPGRRLGLYGFGAAAHIVIQLAHHENREVYAFTRPGDAAAQAFGCQGAESASGGTSTAAPVKSPRRNASSAALA